MSRASVLVNDTWLDGNRNQPPAALTAPFTTTYSEYGTDQDGDGNLESAWFTSPGAAMSVATNHLTMTQQTGSSSYTTYYAPGANAINLANAGDQMKITWVFTPTGVATAGTSQGLRVAVVDSPEASRLTADGAPGTPAAGSTYHGYALFSNMRTGTLGSGSSFQLLKRADTDAAPAAFLSASAAWTATGFTNSTTNNTTTPGYTEGATDTLVMTFTRNAGPDTISGNSDDGMDVTATMTGTGLGANNQGFLTQSATDATPNGFLFDTYGLRPSTAADTAASFDTTNFKVEFTPGTTVPEPASLALLGIAGGLLAARKRRA